MSHHQEKQNNVATEGPQNECGYIFANATNFESYCKKEDLGVKPSAIGAMLCSDNPLIWMLSGIVKGVLVAASAYYVRKEIATLIITSVFVLNEMLTNALSSSRCDYNYYSRIDASDPKKFNCLNQFKKYTIEHNDSYIAMQQCNENDSVITSIFPWHTSEICKSAELDVIGLYLCQDTDH